MSALVSILVLQLVCMSGQGKSKNVFSAENIGAKAALALNNPKRVTVQAAHSPIDVKPNLVLYDYRGESMSVELFGPAREIPAATVGKIVKELQKKVYIVDSACTFRMDHRISWESAHGKLDMLTCFKCQVFLVFFDGHIVGASHTYSYPILERSIREAFTRAEQGEVYLSLTLTPNLVKVLKSAERAKLEELGAQNEPVRERTLTKKQIGEVLNEWGLAQLALIDKEPMKGPPVEWRNYRVTFASAPAITIVFDSKEHLAKLQMGGATYNLSPAISSTTLFARFFESK